MRRFLPTLVVMLVVASSCGDDGGSTATSDSSTTTSSTTTTTTSAPTTTVPSSSSTTTSTTSTTTTIPPEWPGESFSESPLPDVVIADGTQVTLVSSAAENPQDWMADVITTEHPVVEIRMASDGTIVTEELLETGAGLDEVTEVARYAPDGTRSVVAGTSRLYDVAVVGGVEAMIVDVVVEGDIAFGGVTAIPLDGSSGPVDFGLDAEAEFFVTQFDWAGELGVATAISDLTESVLFREIDGGPAPTDELPNPTSGLEYNGPPFVTAATLSADGGTLYWAEGPDWGFDLATNESRPMPAEWRVKSMDLASGEVRLDYPVSEVVVDTAELSISSLHHTGDHLIINRATVIYDEWEDLRPLVLDLGTEEPDLYELPLHGVAAPAPPG